MGMDIIGLEERGHELTQAWDNMGKRNLGMVQCGHGESIGIGKEHRVMWAYSNIIMIHMGTYGTMWSNIIMWHNGYDATSVCSD